MPKKNLFIVLLILNLALTTMPINGKEDQSLRINSINAELIESQSEDILLLKGNVVIKSDKFELWSDEATYDRRKEYIELKGNIKALSKTLSMSAEEMRADFLREEFYLSESSFSFLEKGFGNASNISIRAEGAIELLNISMSSCKDEDLRWDLQAEKITILENRQNVIAENIKLEINEVPVFYIPYVRSAIGNEKFSGFLTPSIKQGKDAGRWRQIGLEGLLRSMDEQVHDEGTDFESSLSYHRLTTEIFAACYALCDLNGVDIPDAFSERLAKMVEFVAAYARPDGLSPQIGDADAGRLQILSRYAGWNRQDHRYLQTIGSVLLDLPDLAAYPEGLADCVWLFGTERTDRNRSLARERPTRSSVGFPAFGFYSLRSGEDELVISASRVGTRGIGNHKHNDVFGIELSLDGEPILVDPGACIYTADSALRNAFRSVTSHNTVTIDDYEQNGIPENNLFGLIESCVPKIHEWVVEGTGEHVFRGSHNGFHGLSEGCHERRVAMSPSADSLFTVADQVSASGEHRARWFFHFHPLATVELAPGLARVTQGRAIAMIGWKAETPIDADLGDGWTSSAYGRREPAPVLTLGTQFKDAVQLDLEIRKL